MTRFTQMIIGTRTDELHVATFSTNGNFGFVIELGEYHRPLVSSEPKFASAQQAEASAQAVIIACVLELEQRAQVIR